jgi:hypothetical protein
MSGSLRFPVANRWSRGAGALLLLTLVLALVSISCSKGPSPPAPGTPGFYWGVAKQAYQSGDFLKAHDNLQKVVATDNEFSARARVWDIVLSGGIAQGQVELADMYELGVRANRANPGPFRKQMTTLRSLASAAALEMTEDVHKYLAVDTDPTVAIDFGSFPAGTPAMPAAVKKIAAGVQMQESEQESLRVAMVQRGVVLTLCRIAGNDEDAAKTAGMMQGGELRVPRESFLLGTARTLADVSDLYGSMKMDLPNRMKALSDEAVEALKTVPPTRETKTLNDRIQKNLKKIKAT